MLQMLTGLLEYGELQDGRFQLKAEPFRVAALAEAIRSALAAEGVPGVEVLVRPGSSERILGDPDRLRQVFVHLTAYVLDGRDQSDASVQLAARRRATWSATSSSSRAAPCSTGASICSPA